jgi:predicted ArsR family transcriptional regulator
MSDARANVLQTMETRIRRDIERGGTGTLSTAEVAERSGLTTAQARRVLDKLEEEGLVDAFDSSDEGAARPSYEWRRAGFEWDPQTETLIEVTPTGIPLTR